MSSPCDTMIDYIKNYVVNNNHKYIHIPDISDVFKIYDLYFNNINTDILDTDAETDTENDDDSADLFNQNRIIENTIIERYLRSEPNDVDIIDKCKESEIVMLYYGIYYGIKGHYNLMTKYYLKSIELGNCDAMVNLGNYYRDIRINSANMLCYYEMAIAKNFKDAAYNLRKRLQSSPLIEYYYSSAAAKGSILGKYKLARYKHKHSMHSDHIEVDYLLSIDYGYINAIYHLGCHYEEKGKYELMKKCLSMVFDLPVKKFITRAMHKLGEYYERTEKKYDLAKKYYLMGVDSEDVECMLSLGAFYFHIEDNIDLVKKYYHMAAETTIKNIISFEDYFAGLLCDDNYDYDYNDLIHLIIKYDRYDLLRRRDDYALNFLNYTITNKDLKLIASKTKEDILLAPHIIKVLHNSLNTHIDIMKLHFDYSVNGIGYDVAKDDFFECVNNINVQNKE